MAKNLENIFKNILDLDARSVGFLIKALEKNNLDGFDYLEFKQALWALSKMPMDESTQFQSAHATAATMGLTKSRLLETASFYTKVLEREKVQFDVALQKQQQKKIGTRLQEAEKLKKGIEKHRATIQKMEQQILEYQKTIDNVQGQIAADQAKISQTKDNFENTFNSVHAHIEQDIVKIQQYIA